MADSQQMKLIKFRVTDFRSIKDSGWIEVDSVSALIGTNESGKTNVLIPLWKLNPVREGEINPLADYPRKRYTEIRNLQKKPVFIEAHFEMSDALVEQIRELTGCDSEEVRIASVKKDFAGTYFIGFPNIIVQKQIARFSVVEPLQHARQSIPQLSMAKSEQSLRDDMLNAIDTALAELRTDPESPLGVQDVESILDILKRVDISSPPVKKTVIVPQYDLLLSAVDEVLEQIASPQPSMVEGVVKVVKENLPGFVYYSNYGNLDSEIYLPHVIQNFNRTDLGSREAAKARTLKVLFDFVGLKAQEIHELGRDYDTRNTGQQPTDVQIQQIAQQKKEREVLLASASYTLTEKFRKWWRQGDYRFRLQADGDHFRIWVSDDLRTEEVELEGRSTGLQWFLSFYLTFLVESRDAHKGAILLLDEAGLSLHPLAQRDLSVFFESLSATNHIIYTSHSPFLVDPDHLDRVHSVYVEEDGTTTTSRNLRALEKNPSRSKSAYAVHAALGLSAADAILPGSKVIIVEGSSDQIYLSAIKNYLIGAKRINPERELVFLPGGGAKGITTLAGIFSDDDGNLPPVLFDSDKTGRDERQKLISGQYQHAKSKVLAVGDFLQLPDAEVEDLFPQDVVGTCVTRYLRGQKTDQDFSEVVAADKPMLSQIESYAKAHQIDLESGWKVHVARLVKQRLPQTNIKIDSRLEDTWTKMFEQFETL